MKRHGERSLGAALITAIAATACGEAGPVDPATTGTTGAIRVIVTMTGVELASVYGARAENQIVVADRDKPAVLKRVSPGARLVELRLPSNCQVVGENPRPVTVAARQTVTVSFSVGCVSTTGAVRVTAQTTGTDADLNGYTVGMIGLNQTGTRYDRTELVATSGAPTVLSLPVGQATLTLKDVAINCFLRGSNPRTVRVEPSASVDVEFPVECERKRQLAYVSYLPDRDIFLANDDGSDVRRLTATPSRDDDPAWSPDGSRLAFTSDRDGNREVYTMNADGSAVVRLTNEPGSDYQPAWSPDGGKIAFVSERTGAPQVFVMNADGSDAVRLTNSTAADYEPAWSPDGRRLAFTTDRHGDPELYIMNADGSSAERLTSGGGRQAAWSPDGARIAYSARFCSAFYYFCYSSIFIRTGSLTTFAIGSGVGERPRWSPDGRAIAYTGFNCDYYFSNCAEGAFRFARVGDEVDLVMGGAGYAPTWRPR